MLKGFKLGIGNGKQLSAILLLLVAVASPAKLHAEDKRIAVAQLHIQVNVIPTLIAAAQARQVAAQPSQSPVIFNLAPETKQNSDLSTRIIKVSATNGTEQIAVLNTTTVVTE